MYVGGERAARENFYTRVIPAEVARADAIRGLFYGGSEPFRRHQRQKCQRKLDGCPSACVGLAIAVLLTAANCSRMPPTASIVISPIRAGTARIWIYRNDGPNEIQASPYLRLNGRVAGISERTSFLRDVTPGRYVVTVDSYIDTYVGQVRICRSRCRTGGLCQVLSMLRDKIGGEAGGSRDIFYTRLIPADIAQPAIAVTPFYGGG